MIAPAFNLCVKGTAREIRCRKATDPRLLRDESPATKDCKIAGLPKGTGQHDATLTFEGEISGNGCGGLSLDGTEALISDSTVTDSISLGFGTRVDFAGSNTVTGDVSCDETVLTRGDVSCPPAPLQGVRSPGAEGSEKSDLPRKPAAVRAFRMEE